MPALAPLWPVGRLLFHQETSPNGIIYEAITGPTEHIGQVVFTRTSGKGKKQEIIAVYCDGHWCKPFSIPRPPLFPRSMILEVEAAIRKIQDDMLTTSPF